MIDELLQPLVLGGVTLKNRVVMAPLTRMRAGKGYVPTAINAKYYGQRSSAGLIITEATQISQQGMGYPDTPGIYSEEQVQGWKEVTGKVHAEGGLIFLQLWHVGRISHSSFQPDGAVPLAPSAIAAAGKTLTAAWEEVPFETPRAMEAAEIKVLIEQYRASAVLARDAGFDGVELHAANGYLLNQFLSAVSNQRTDEYGGNPENRARLLFLILDELIDVWGADRIGIRFSPYFTQYDALDPEYFQTYSYIFKKLNDLGLAYIHLIRYRPDGSPEETKKTKEKALWELYSGNIIAADGFNPESAEEYIREGKADAIAFGRLYLANPDLPRRIKEGAVFNEGDRSTYYGGSEKGYTDYPFLNSGRES